MNAKQCDCCKQFYQPAEQKFSGIMFITLHFYNIRNKDIDLCPTCQLHLLDRLGLDGNGKKLMPAPERINDMVSVPPDSEGF